MPLYEYRCTNCGYKFEKIQKFSDAPEQVCPKCGGELVRPMTAPALKFEGAGWYINDYAPKAGASTSGGESKSESKGSEAPSTAASPASESSSGPGSGNTANAGSTSAGSSGSSSPSTAS